MPQPAYDDYLNKKAAAARVVDRTEDAPDVGQAGQVFNHISEELTNLQQIVGALETRLSNILLPSGPSTASETPKLPPASPLTSGLFDLALRLQQTREYVQDIYRRIDV